uniref:BTB domain-containing protein n=1 Tax=Panagrellus redivivus TaxID=6233 RepID=A0A7E4VF56_PANRE
MVAFATPTDDQHVFALNAFREFNRIRQTGNMCDITIMSKGRFFTAHKVVLAASIPYFHLMFTCGLAESRETTVYLDSHDPNAIEAIITYAYTGSINITKENVLSLLIVAAYMQMEDLVIKCQEVLPDVYDTVNVFKALEIGSLYDNEHIMDSASRFLRLNFKACSETTEFVDLNIDTICAVVSNNQLHVESEDDILDAVIRWIRHEPGTRAQHATKVLKFVRFALVNTDKIKEIASDETLRVSPSCRELLTKAIQYHSVPQDRVLNQSMMTEETRECTDAPGIIYVVGGLGQDNSAVEFFDPLGSCWVQSKQMPTSRARMGVAVLNRKLYAIGGSTGIEKVKNVETFDTDTNIWEQKPALLQRRSASTTVTVRGTIYVIGGFDGYDILSTVEAYRPNWRTWIVRPQLQTERCASAGIALGDKIFVLGGHSHFSITASTEVTEVGQHNITPWKFGPELPGPRCRHGAAVINNQIYMAGGYDGTHFLDTMFMYDPEKDKWFPRASLNLKRSRMAFVGTGNILYAVGGHDGANNISSIEIYDPREDKWHFGPSMKSHEGGVVAGVIPVSAKEVNIFSNLSSLRF